MNIDKDIKFDWDNISIVPAVMSDISTRDDININTENNKLPLFVSPMDTVVDEHNAKVFLDEGFEVCLPRGIGYVDDLDDCFFSYGLDEIIDIVDNDGNLPPKVLIDIANGHMIKLYNIAKRIKETYDIILMVGNIANPQTYKLYCDIGVDYIRCSIGSGKACTTSANSGVHYPPASLIKECFDISCTYDNPTKIIGDGGFSNFSNIIKAIAIGAHGVMLGSIINKSLESCSPNFYLNSSTNQYQEISNKIAKEMLDSKGDVYKYYRGMSTKEVQVKWNKKELKTAEGISMYNTVDYTISGWVSNFSSYLKTNMSYCNKRNLESYRGEVTIKFITSEAYNRYNK